MPSPSSSVPEINCVNDLIEVVKGSGLMAQRNAHLRIWFRGQAKKEWKLEPGVYRSTFPAKDDRERLALERQLAQDFRVQSAGLLTREFNEAELYFLEQHYRMPTRLLDWSGSPLAALYFAVKEEPGSDGALFMMDAFELASTQKAVKFLGIATSRHPTFTTALKRITWWSDDFPFPEFVLPVRPDHFEKRVVLQRSYFTFHVPSHPAVTLAENGTLRQFIIPSKSKEELLKELFFLGIDEFSIYGDLESLSRRLKTAHHVP
jgi:hypothetical protein